MIVLKPKEYKGMIVLVILIFCICFFGYSLFASSADLQNIRIGNKNIKNAKQKNEAVQKIEQMSDKLNSAAKQIWEFAEIALEEFLRIEEENLPRLKVSKNRDILEALEIMNGLIVGELIARSAILRTESRGAHYRSDYPTQNDQEWLKCIIIKRSGDEKTLYPVLAYEDVH